MTRCYHFARIKTGSSIAPRSAEHYRIGPAGWTGPHPGDPPRTSCEVGWYVTGWEGNLGLPWWEWLALVRRDPDAASRQFEWPAGVRSALVAALGRGPAEADA